MGSPDLVFRLEAGVYSACGCRVFLTLFSLSLGFDVSLESQVVSNRAIFMVPPAYVGLTHFKEMLQVIR